jgi:hypothetical protein
MLKRTTDNDSREQKLQREADRIVSHAMYMLEKVIKAPSLCNSAPPAPPNEIDDILEGLDR